MLPAGNSPDVPPELRTALQQVDDLRQQVEKERRKRKKAEKKEEGGKDEEAEEDKGFEIDLDGFERRVVVLPADGGNDVIHSPGNGDAERTSAA